VRYRLMATYQGSPFEAGIGPAQGDIVLFAACPPPEDLGFEPATGHWRKQLRLSDVQAVWESRPVGMFRGERCMVVDDLGDRLHIGYLGHDGFKAEQLGYWQVDRGVFELVALRSEVTDIVEERTEYPRLLSESRPDTGSLPAVRPDSAGYARPSGQYSVPAGYASGTSGQYTTPGGSSPGASGQYTTPVGRGQGPSGQGASGQGATPGASVPSTPGQHAAPAAQRLSSPSAEDAGLGGDLISPAYVPVPDSSTGVALPVAAPAPLPLEAEALRAASAARRPRPAARRGAPARSAAAMPDAPPITVDAVPAAQPRPATQPRQRRSGRSRLATERLFADLAALAGIPADSYVVGDVVDGAMCLVQTAQGFEVFHSAGASRQELQVFATEESACFYLFGILTAEAVRNGSLARVPAGLGTGQAASA
jgi:hypothetical protein